MNGRQNPVAEGADEALGAEQHHVIAVGHDVGLEKHGNNLLLRSRQPTVRVQRGVGQSQMLHGGMKNAEVRKNAVYTEEY